MAQKILTIEEKLRHYPQHELNLGFFKHVKPRYTVEHTHNKLKHFVECYEYELEPNIMYYWAYCVECQKLIHKRITGFDKVANLAYTFEFIKDGNTVIHV